MVKRQTAVVEIGSSSIVTLIGERGVNNSLKVLGKGEVNYDGFSNGKFFSPADLKNVIAMSISNAESMSGLKISEVMVGVPGEFCLSYCQDVKLAFESKKKVKDTDIRELVKRGVRSHPSYSCINTSAIYYTLDDGKRVINPINKHTTSLTGKICYIFADNVLLKFITGIFGQLGIKSVIYMSSNLAEMIYLIDPSIRDRYAILADVGYMTTNVMLGQGDGLLFLSSFSLGGGHITGDLYQVLKIPFSEAETLKHKIVLNWQPSENDTYEVLGSEFVNTYSAKATNEITEARIEMIATYIQKCLNNCPYDFPDYLPLYLTGGGICFIRGVKDVLSKKLGRKVEIVENRTSSYMSADLSAEISLLEMSINQAENGYNLIYSARW